jgi:glycosyltransferase involved in cell wall biosynthesis
MSSTVAVVIPAYNHAAYVGVAIASALAQTRPPDEVIVVDDGSRDDTARVLEAWEGRVTVLRQTNQGVAVARNNGVARSRCDYVAFLDADDEWRPAKLERQVALLDADPAIALAHCGLEEIDAAGHVLRFRTDGAAGEVWREMLLFLPAVLGTGSTALVRRTVFDALGGFDRRLSTSADWDLCFQIAVRHRVGFVAEPLVRYRLHGQNMHLGVATMERDMLLAYDKAFALRDPRVDAMRRAAFGALHSVLAGSYFRTGDYGPALRHASWTAFHAPRFFLSRALRRPGRRA